MRKPVLFLVTALVAAVLIFVGRHFEFDLRDGFQVRPRTQRETPLPARVARSAPGPSSPSPGGNSTLRVASLQLEPLDATRITSQEYLRYVARMLARFDVIALQGVRLDGPKPITPLVDALSQLGRHYRALCGPLVGPAPDRQRFCLLYDQQRLVADDFGAYTVQEEGDLFRYEPFVGWFRTRGVPDDEAFTFSVVSIYTDPERRDEELSSLPRLMSAVQNDGRGEDDVLLVGTFGAAGGDIASSWNSSRLSVLIRFTDPQYQTTTDREAQLDNFAIDTWATTEFTGHSGVFDFLHEFNLRLDDALRISRHLPVWAEFHTRESPTSPSVAARRARSRAE